MTFVARRMRLKALPRFTVVNFKAYWRRVITTRYSRALFKGAADMQQQLTGSDKTLDPTRELALV